MLCYENCPHCNADITFRVLSSNDWDDICYEIEIEDLEDSDGTIIESGMVYNDNEMQCCAKCGKVVNIDVSTIVKISAE